MDHRSRRSLLKGAGIITATTLISNSATAAETSPQVREFDVSELPSSISYLSDPKARQREAWEVAKTIHRLEQEASEEFRKYSTEELAAIVENTPEARTDLRSLSRLIEILHENDLAGIIDESMLNSIGKRADIIVRYAPLLGSVNNVLNKAESFAEAALGSRREEYLNFVLSIACLCLEAGLMWVGVPYKLAWKGTHTVFFARSGTLFRLGRYGGDRFVAFFMSEIHWELREALFNDVVTTEKARWVTNQVNSHHEVPSFTAVRSDVSGFIREQSEFSADDLRQYKFASEFVDSATDSGWEVLGEASELIPKSSIPSSSANSESLILTSTMDWETSTDSEDSPLPFGF